MRITFGKYKGTEIAELPHHYLTFLNNIQDLDPAIRIEVLSTLGNSQVDDYLQRVEQPIDPFAKDEEQPKPKAKRKRRRKQEDDIFTKLRSQTIQDNWDLIEEMGWEDADPMDQFNMIQSIESAMND